MSETTEQPVPGSEPAPEPQPAPDAPAPETDAPEQEEERKSRGDRRIAALTAQLSAREREREALRVENEAYRRQLAGQAPEQDTPEQARQRLRMEVRAEVETEIKIKNLHDQGFAQYADWDERRNRVVDMGGDAQFAQLVIDMPPAEGVRVVAALAEDPEALQRIVKLQGERARAVALGKYAATLDDAPAPRVTVSTTPTVTRAPAPIRPVTGRVTPQPNPYNMSGQEAVDYFMAQNLERQQRR